MLIPQHGRLLIQMIEKSDMEKRGEIYIPGREVEEEDLLRGIVCSMNDEYEIGTRVFYSKFSAVTVKNDHDTDQSHKYHIVHSGDVLAIDDAK